MSQIVSDPRFAALHSDPRFQRIPARERKVAVDERFNAIFTDENFSDAALALDKRGRTPKKKKSKRASDETLQHVFDMRPEDDAIAHIRETTAGAAVKPKASASATARKKRPAASGSANTNKGTSKKAASSTIATPVDSRKSKQHKGARRVPTARPSGSDDIAKALVQDNGGDDEITDGAGVWVREDDVDEREGGDEGEGETSEAETTEDEDDVEQVRGANLPATAFVIFNQHADSCEGIHFRNQHIHAPTRISALDDSVRSQVDAAGLSACFSILVTPFDQLLDFRVMPTRRRKVRSWNGSSEKQR
eukprot:6211155-Pleurochrysis_carterae.AAC.3